MKATGITRPVDALGRIVLPKSLRQQFGIEVDQHLEIFTDGNRIILQKYERGCLFCGSAEQLVSFSEKQICKDCLAKLKKL